MHILFFIYSLNGGGAERVTVNLANHWVKQDKKVTIVTLAGREQDAYPLDGRIHRIALNLASGNDGLVAALRNNWLRVRALRRVLHRAMPDVAVGVMSTASCLLAMAGRPPGGIAVGSERIHPPMVPLGRAWELVRKVSYGQLDAVVAQTETSANWLKTHTRVRRAPVIFNPLSFPLPAGEPILKPVDYLDPGRKTILTVGRLAQQKGHDRLLRAFARVTVEFPDWQLAILGEGPLRGELGRPRARARS